MTTVAKPPKSKSKSLVKQLDEKKELSPQELEEKIKKLTEFFDATGIGYDKFKPEHLSFLDYKKKAYPNYDQYMYIPAQHDMKKWMSALTNIFQQKRAGLPYKQSILSATRGWQKMEIYDFLNWLKFHQEGTHMKYKFAQSWYVNDGMPGYILPYKRDPEPTVEDPIADANAVNDAREKAEQTEEKKQLIEKQRQKIIGRLDSAEKLLRSPEGQMFAGPEMEGLMEAIYSLKKKVQLVNKLSLSVRLYEDMIVREANVLSRAGFRKAADLLYSVAQTPGASAEGAKGKKDGGALPETSPPPDPSGAGQSGTMSGLPSTSPGTPSVQTPVDGDQNKDQPPAGALVGPTGPAGTAVSSPAIVPQEAPAPEGINKFISAMNEGDESDKGDKLVVDDDNLEVSDPEEDMMVTEAQAAPPGPRIPPAALEDVPMTDSPTPDRNPPAFIPPASDKPDEDADKPAVPGKKPLPGKSLDDEPLEVTEDDIPTTNFDNKIDQVMAGATIADAIAELESISQSYKSREQPRRLSRADMILDYLGLASYFPQLSEAQAKALEANNYISTRIDNILSQLRGAMASENAAAPPTGKPDVSGVKNKLQSDQDKETKRKQMRKEQENADLEGANKETPAVEMGELGPPAAPAAPPKAPPTPRPLG